MHKFSVLIKGKIKNYNKKIYGKEFPDKSITHRAYILGSQCLGVTKIKGLNSEDFQVTINALKKLGIKIVSKKIGIMFTVMEFQVLKNLAEL